MCEGVSPITDRNLLELIATKVGKLTIDVEEIMKTLPTLATKEELAEVKNIVIRIENDHGQKLGALLDGYKLHSEKLDRHEAIISKLRDIRLSPHHVMYQVNCSATPASDRRPSQYLS